MHSPTSILRVRGGRPLSGGPSVADFAEQETETATETAIPEAVIHAGRPRSISAPKSVLRLGPDSTPTLPDSPFLLPSVPPLPSVDRYKPAYPDEDEPVVQEQELPTFQFPPVDGPQSDFQEIPSPGIARSTASSTAPSPIPSPQYPVPSPDPANILMMTLELFKSFRKGKITVPVLKGVNLGVRSGEFLSIIGQSGSGKSTLLHLLGTLDVPDSGTIQFDGQRIDNISRAQRDILRNQFIGMIFQFYHLLPELTTLENVLSPLMIRHGVLDYWWNRKRNMEKATHLLDQVGLSHRLHHKPSELSGGEMQRAAIARSLITDPQILLADEPTGNLDAKTAQEILELLRRMNVERKLTVVLVTHDMQIADQADRIVRLVDGRVD